MPIGNILKRASSLILGEDDDAQKSAGKIDISYEDNEILFCKNNVCIHPPLMTRQEYGVVHYPGYLTVATKTFVDQCNSAKRSTLFLTWIPNSVLCKCKSDDDYRANYSDQSTPTSFSTKSSLSEAPPRKYEQIVQDASAVESNCNHENGSIDDGNEKCSNAIPKNTEGNLQNGDHEHEEGSLLQPDNTINGTDIQELRNELQPLLGGRKTSLDNLRNLMQSDPITTVNITISNPQIENIDLTQTYNCLMVTAHRDTVAGTTLVTEDRNPNWMTPELLAFKYNLSFPESNTTTPLTRRKSSSGPLKCRRFSVDLCQMRSLRLFFNDSNCTSGQLVIASRESQYKILHFHYGGLDHLAQVNRFSLILINIL